MSRPFGKVPARAFNSPSPFNVAVPQAQLAEFHTLLKLSKIAAPTYESLQDDGKFGVTHKWITEAKEYWLNQFDWCVRAITRAIILLLGGSADNFQAGMRNADELCSSLQDPGAQWRGRSGYPLYRPVLRTTRRHPDPVAPRLAGQHSRVSAHSVRPREQIYSFDPSLSFYRPLATWLCLLLTSSSE